MLERRGQALIAHCEICDEQEDEDLCDSDYVDCIQHFEDKGWMKIRNKENGFYLWFCCRECYTEWKKKTSVRR